MIYVVVQYWLPALLALMAGIVVGWWYQFPAEIRRGHQSPDSD